MPEPLCFCRCGDANVIRAGRGFRTSSMQNDDGDTIRIARSVFFRAFALLNSPSVEFKCDYIIRTDSSADGVSSYVIHSIYIYPLPNRPLPPPNPRGSIVLAMLSLA